MIHLSSKITQLEIDAMLERTKRDDVTKEELYNQLSRRGFFQEASGIHRMIEKEEADANEKEKG